MARPAVDFNYGAAPDLQLTATLPAGFSQSAPGGTNFGLSNIELAAKYRFLHQDTFGLDVAVFPRVFLPSGSNTIGDNHTSVLLPVWVEKDWKAGWSAFGGGGCTFSAIRTADFCLAGAVLTYQLMPKLQIGAELFHRTADSKAPPPHPVSAWVGAMISARTSICSVMSGEELRTRSKLIAIPGTHPFCSPSETGPWDCAGSSPAVASMHVAARVAPRCRSMAVASAHAGRKFGESS